MSIQLTNKIGVPYKKHYSKALMSIQFGSYQVIKEKKMAVTRNDYVKFIPYETRETVDDWFSKGIKYIQHINSNNDVDEFAKYRSQVEKVLDYKDQTKKNYKAKEGKRAYVNIYAYELLILFPKELTNDIERHKFVPEYITTLDKRFKNLLYFYKLVQRGDGRYASVLLFNRYVYKRPTSKPDKWADTYYQDPETKQRANPKTNPNAVLMHKKGDVKKDNDGKPIMKKMLVKATAERVFVYKNFRDFHIKLNDKLWVVINDMCSNWFSIKQISKRTIDYGDNSDSDIVKKIKLQHNVYVSKINDLLVNYQQSANTHLLDTFSANDNQLFEKLDSLINTVNKKIYKDKEALSKVKSYVTSWWYTNVAKEMQEE